jgi:putative ABC transport system substrate-binding protein
MGHALRQELVAGGGVLQSFMRAHGSPVRSQRSAPFLLVMLYLMVLTTPARPAQIQSADPPPGKIYRVGFSQFGDHAALNTVRQGFVDGLRDGGFIEGKNLVFEYQNAQGDVANARNIAEKFIADGVDLLAACATPNALATIKVARGGKVPVVFGCVTDPVASGVLTSLDRPTGINVTGLYDSLPVAELMEVLAEILPRAKTLGTVYNSGDANSVRGNAIAKAMAAHRGFRWVEAHIASSAEVKTAVESLVGRVDVFYMLEDNTLASAFDAVVKTARENRIPLFSLDTTSAKRGAVASYGTDEYKMGYAWATQVAVPVLKGSNPATLAPVPYKIHNLYLNTASAAFYNLLLPLTLRQSAYETYDK